MVVGDAHHAFEQRQVERRGRLAWRNLDAGETQSVVRFYHHAVAALQVQSVA